MVTDYLYNRDGIAIWPSAEGYWINIGGEVCITGKEILSITERTYSQITNFFRAHNPAVIGAMQRKGIGIEKLATALERTKEKVEDKIGKPEYKPLVPKIFS